MAVPSPVDTIKSVAVSGIETTGVGVGVGVDAVAPIKAALLSIPFSAESEHAENAKTNALAAIICFNGILKCLNFTLPPNGLSVKKAK